MNGITDRGQQAAEPLVSPADTETFKVGLAAYAAGRWYEDRWKTFRLRFGIYEQRQAGQHMVRLKVPGGRLTTAQARAIAAAARDHADGKIHLTTRQGIQLYFVALERLPALLETLQEGDVTTREASGGTLRNTTACLGCARAVADAGAVADNLARSWLRHPLVQHLPRKVKTAVSGCAMDCGLSRIDDLGFTAVERDGQQGFQVTAGGGLGTHPRVAVKVLDFVDQSQLPAVQEAIARVHHRHSKRHDKNRSRIKFLVDRFGPQEFARLVQEEFASILDLPRRVWRPLPTPVGQDRLVVDAPLGILSADQLEAVAALSDGADIQLTRDQNLVVSGLGPARAGTFADALAACGLRPFSTSDPLGNLVACFGTSTCAIGITDANALAREVLDSASEFDGMPALRLRISGCHNSCGHHHIADIGLHGLAKKIDGKPAPHYQLHLGGDTEVHGILGPIFPARRAKEVLVRLVRAYGEDRRDGETVRAWGERIGEDGVAALVRAALDAPRNIQAPLTVDVGASVTFVPPVTSVGECAAGTVVAEHLDDLGRVALENVRRALAVGRRDDAISYGALAFDLPAQRLLTIAGEVPGTPERSIETIRDLWSADGNLLTGLARARGALDAFTAGGDWEDSEAALIAWQEVAHARVEAILEDVSGFLARGAAE